MSIQFIKIQAVVSAIIMCVREINVQVNGQNILTTIKYRRAAQHRCTTQKTHVMMNIERNNEMMEAGVSNRNKDKGRKEKRNDRNKPIKPKHMNN